ncbi:distal membrane-arm assembly complex protein 1 [Orycteropus afer afer]|uniref:Distal membrane-arm assembly complex protein 1 n=1 Tax=Orycteropus afer afer TaxID=1230840 RepID=A0A8B7B411_ORYAF|nr:distal membrane-arm assembly complex protein 1 [Orycteropus afer afer]
MGSFTSQPVDLGKVAAPAESTAPAIPASLSSAGVSTSPAQGPQLNNCWSCRLLSASGLIGAGGYVYWKAQKPLKQGYGSTPGTIMQMVVGLSFAVWGLIILIDPKRKTYRAD